MSFTLPPGSPVDGPVSRLVVNGPVDMTVDDQSSSDQDEDMSDVLSPVLSCLPWLCPPLDGGFCVPVSYGGVPCAFLEYIADATCMLAVDADSPSVAEDVFNLLAWTDPDVLVNLRGSFSFVRYSDFRPYRLQFFHFASCRVVQAPFPPFTQLTWTGANISHPYVSYETGEDAVCSIHHPFTHPLFWDDILTVLTSSSQLESLVLDSLFYQWMAGTVVSTPPFPLLVELELSFRDDSSMAEFVSRINAPALASLGIVFTTAEDMKCLSAKYMLVALVNWNACPMLKKIVVHGASLTIVWNLITSRRNTGYAELEVIVVFDPEGGRNTTVEGWITACRIHLIVT
ncbi:hypothetical protein C8R46DRAFT_1030666 [Mycena filopes]|nr:hypothetical protein C8R46DRAFT_1030666 [Mycena filopes]